MTFQGKWKELTLHWICWGNVNEGTVDPTARRTGDRGTVLLGTVETLPWKEKEVPIITFHICTLTEALDIIINIEVYCYFIDLVILATKIVVLKQWAKGRCCGAVG